MIGKISGQKSLFGTALVSFLDPNNSWIKLANKLPWSRIERELSVYFCEDNGRPCLPIRRMVGLLLIKQLEDLSDEAVVENGGSTLIGNICVVRLKCNTSPHALPMN